MEPNQTVNHLISQFGDNRLIENNVALHFVQKTFLELEINLRNIKVFVVILIFEFS